VGDYTVKGTLVQDFEQLAQRVLFSKVVDSKTRVVRFFRVRWFCFFHFRFTLVTRTTCASTVMRDVSCATRRQASFPCGRWYSAVYGTRLATLLFLLIRHARRNFHARADGSRESRCALTKPCKPCSLPVPQERLRSRRYTRGLVYGTPTTLTLTHPHHTCPFSLRAGAPLSPAPAPAPTRASHSNPPAPVPLLRRSPEGAISGAPWDPATCRFRCCRRCRRRPRR
jgi:hypothetical protein